MSNVTETPVKPLEASVAIDRPPTWIWVHVTIAALAMAATLPGRTHGLGLITEPLLKELQLGRVPFAEINFWGTLIGAAFCLPCGWLIDRYGIRIVLTGIAAALGIVVLLMSRIEGTYITFNLPWSSDQQGVETYSVMIDLFVLVLLTRGFGQSALSVASLALIGQAAGRRSGLAVGVYSFLVSICFMAAFKSIGYAEKEWQADWRTLWASVGWAVLAFAVVSCVLVRPQLSGWAAAPSPSPAPAVTAIGMTLGQALRTPTFWVFSVSSSLYLLIVSGISLFNQSILEERNFNREVFITITTYTPLFGLASNLVTGWLATRWPMGRLLAVAMLILTGGLLAFPLVQALWHVYLYAIALGIAGGMVTVLFFAVWGQAFGPAHLGKIQGAAQMMTVFASALGPWLLAQCKEQTGNYLLFYQIAAGATALLTVAAWWTGLPLLGRKLAKN